MYSSNETFPKKEMNQIISVSFLPTVKKASSNQKKKRKNLREIKVKLQKYVAENNSEKDKRLLENHAHCFILLS